MDFIKISFFTIYFQVYQRVIQSRKREDDGNKIYQFALILLTVFNLKQYKTDMNILCTLRLC